MRFRDVLGVGTVKVARSGFAVALFVVVTAALVSSLHAAPVRYGDTWGGGSSFGWSRVALSNYGPQPSYNLRYVEDPLPHTTPSGVMPLSLNSDGAVSPGSLSLGSDPASRLQAGNSAPPPSVLPPIPEKPKSGHWVTTLIVPPGWVYDPGTPGTTPPVTPGTEVAIATKRMFLASSPDPTNIVPEPGTWALMLSGAAGLGLLRLRRKK